MIKPLLLTGLCVFFLLVTKTSTALISHSRKNISATTAEVEDRSAHAISPLRPRIFIRNDKAKSGRGLTVSELKLRVKNGAYPRWIQPPDNIDGWTDLPSMAMQYILTGEKKYALAVGKYLSETPFPYREHTSSAAAVYHSAVAFDWVRDALADDVASKISDQLVEGAEYLKEAVIVPSINHNYTIVSLYGLTVSAIAIYGESEEKSERALAYLQMVEDLLRNENMSLETFAQKEGVWGEGNHYTPYVVYYPFLMSLKALTSATDTDYFNLIRTEYDNFIEPMSKFVIANFRPDFTLERIGDVLRRVVPTGTLMRPLLELLASEIADVKLQGQVRSFSSELANYYGDALVPDHYDWMMVLHYDWRLPQTPSYKTLPLAMRLGKNAFEHIMFRNSWEKDGTLISYISGDQYTDHQHLDKGHFLIYKKGGLAIDAGGYGRPMYGANWANYSTRTLAHNNVLIYDPDQPTYKGTYDRVIYPDGGQRIMRPGDQNQQSWKEFQEIKDSVGLDAGNVLEFEADHQNNRYHYVKSDLTNAYYGKAEWIDRQLLYLPLADYLVVRDRIVTDTPKDKFWLLHFEQTPRVDSEIPETGISEYKRGSTVRAHRNDTLTAGGKTITYSGALFVKPLLPRKREIAIVGGEGYEYYNRFADKNFPNSRPFSPVVEPGNWRMEVSTKRPETSTVFLHVLEITDGEKTGMIETEYLTSKDDKMGGVLFRSPQTHYLVLFSKRMDKRGNTFQKTEAPIDYQLKASAPAIHVLTELQANKKVSVVINDKHIGSFQTSEAGILSFEDSGTGRRKVEIRM